MMTPIDRMNLKSKALDTLGLRAGATGDDIRNAFRKMAFEKHPDKCNGSTEDFQKIGAAYEYLRANADAPSQAPTPARTVSRPSVQSTETKFSNDTLEVCRSQAANTKGTAVHIASQLFRRGRKLSYFVTAAPAEGTNKVVVPTGDLVDSRYVMPQTVEFDARDVAAGVYNVPGEICASLFPGARSVHIQFAWGT